MLYKSENIWLIEFYQYNKTRFIYKILKMETLQKDIINTSNNIGKINKSWDILENFYQKKSINEDLQNLGLRFLNIKNSLLKTWLEENLHKNNVDDDMYRCFIHIYKFIDSYKLNDLIGLANYYKELYRESESKLIHFNKTKREQIHFLQKTFEYFLSDFKSLKEKIKNSSLGFIKENAFRKPESFSINQKHIQEMQLFLNEFPSRINSIQKFLDKIYTLWSSKTKEKLDEYKKMERYV